MPWLLSLAAGMLLYLSNHPLHWWPLQFVAFVPFWAALARQRQRGGWLFPIGLVVAVGSAGLVAVNAGASAPVLAAAAASALQWALAAALAGRLILRGRVLGPLGAAAAFALVEIAVWNAVPLFGTAQCSVRPLSAAPAALGFVAYTGVGGLVFAVAAVQALAAAAWAARRSRAWRAPLVAAAVLIALAASASWLRWARPLGEPVRVAVAGWDRPRSADGIRGYYGGRFADADRAGASLLVTPEVGIRTGVSGWGFETRALALEFLSGQAREHGIAAVIGVWSDQHGDNRIWFFDERGALRGEYQKCRLVPFFEDYPAGNGEAVVLPLGDAAVGGMICQDDNFTWPARGYGARGTPLVAVPTNDWPAIREFHFDNGVFRALENGYAVARAASGGISALLSPRGEVIARHDHTVDSERVLVADVPLGDGEPTVYARFGDLPITVLCALLCVAAWRRRALPSASS